MRNALLVVWLICPMLALAQRGSWEYKGNGATANKVKSDTSKVITDKPHNLKDEPESRQVPKSGAKFDLGSETHPAPRMASAAWSDKKGNMYVFGGSGIDEENAYGGFTDFSPFRVSVRDSLKR